MIKPQLQDTADNISSLEDLAKLADYSFMNNLNCDPDANYNGVDHESRQVFTGHYVTVKPTPIEAPVYVSHSKALFGELGFADNMAQSSAFIRVFSGDISFVPAPMKKLGWACGYALSIYGTEYNQQCPFQTGNGYGDGRAISVLEAVINGKRWEMQLKGGGRTPYCRGADGRAVLRSSVREFLAQEYMHALGVPTSRSLSLYVSQTEKVMRPWYSEGSQSADPDSFISEPVAISTRVAPSFIRVGQLELFGRRARNNEHPQAMEELEQIVMHLIEREYDDVIDSTLALENKIVLLAGEFRHRLISLIANWIRVGYCQGNFNSDNCAAGGFTLDYGPFGFCEVFNPYFQPWTGGGRHFSFLNQPMAAQRNYQMFCSALKPLLAGHPDSLRKLDELQTDFARLMQTEMETMWADKLGLSHFDEALFKELIILMMQTPVDYTLFFRELSSLPDDIGPLKRSFYRQPGPFGGVAKSTSPTDEKDMDNRWRQWLKKWRALLATETRYRSSEEISSQMKRINPKYSFREWLVAPAYQQANAGDYSLVRELQEVMSQPYAEQSEDVEEQYYRLKPAQLFGVGGLSHYSCSS